MRGAPGLTGASLVILLDPHALKANSLKIYKKKCSKKLAYTASVSTSNSTKAFFQKVVECHLQDINYNYEGYTERSG